MPDADEKYAIVFRIKREAHGDRDVYIKFDQRLIFPLIEEGGKLQTVSPLEVFDELAVEPGFSADKR